MPYNPPIPDSKRAPDDRPKRSGPPIIPVQAGRMMEVAFLLPCSAFVGWGIGWWLDKTLHQTWISLVGILLGGLSGIVYVVRMVVTGTGSKRQPPGLQDDGRHIGGPGNGGPKS